MNKNQQTDCQTMHLIEKEYINNMLGTSCLDIDPSDATSKTTDFNSAYKKENIECRVFNVAGLNIAVPESNIRKTLKQQKIFQGDQDDSQPAMRAGTIDHDDEIIEVIDIERLAMNGINNIDNSSNSKQRSADIVLLKDCSTGFICNATLDKQTVSNEQVRWRDTDSKRIWLAGTVARLGLSLLDIEGVIRLLHAQDQNNEEL